MRTPQLVWVFVASTLMMGVAACGPDEAPVATSVPAVSAADDSKEILTLMVSDQESDLAKRGYLVTTRTDLVQASLDIADFIDASITSGRVPLAAAAVLPAFIKDAGTEFAGGANDALSVSKFAVNGEDFTFSLKAPSVTDGAKTVTYDSVLVNKDIEAYFNTLDDASGASQ